MNDLYGGVNVEDSAGLGGNVMLGPRPTDLSLSLSLQLSHCIFQLSTSGLILY